MKRSVVTMVVTITLLGGVMGQDLIRVGTGFSFEGDDEFVQSITIDFNRAEAKKEKDGIYFLHTENTYIRPVIDVNLGESVSTSQNNARFAVRFGKNLISDDKKKRWRYFFVNLEPTYNADKTFTEELYYINLNGGVVLNKDKDTSVDLIKPNAAGGSGTAYAKPFTKREFIFTLGTSNNLGGRDSKTFSTSNSYITGGGFLSFSIRWNKNNLAELQKDAKKKGDGFDYANANLKKYANWKFEIKGTLYSIVNELDEITEDESAGLLKVSLDKMISPKAYASLSYQYGNDQPAYENINALELGLKIKFEE